MGGPGESQTRNTKKKDFAGNFHLSKLFIGPSPHPPSAHALASPQLVPAYPPARAKYPSTRRPPLSPSWPAPLSTHRSPQRSAWRRKAAHTSDFVYTSAATYTRALSFCAGNMQQRLVRLVKVQ